MTPYYADDWLTVHQGDCREVMATMEPESVHCVVTSPPYWGLRDYGEAGQLGLEPTPELYVAAMVEVFREIRRVLRNDGTVWLNLGDAYNAGTSAKRKPSVQPSNDVGYWLNAGAMGDERVNAPGLAAKQLLGMPWRVAFALQADGWYLRSDIIWSKPNPMPESVTDRPTKAHEYLFLLSKSARYFYDAEAVKEGAMFSGPNGPQHSPYGQGFTRRSDKQAEMAAAQTSDRAHRSAGFNDRWDASELDGTVPLSRNLRSVWTIATQPYPGAHFATFPEALVEPCVKAGSPEGGVVLDPFGGSGTTARVANRMSRRAILIDLSTDYLDQAMVRNAQSPIGLVG